jgi:hypothetical protein
MQVCHAVAQHHKDARLGLADEPVRLTARACQKQRGLRIMSITVIFDNKGGKDNSIDTNYMDADKQLVTVKEHERAHGDSIGTNFSARCNDRAAARTLLLP